MCVWFSAIVPKGVVINVPSPKSHVNLAVLVQFDRSPMTVLFSNSTGVFTHSIFEGTSNKASEGS